MGTRSLTTFKEDHNNEEIVVLYRQFDGYPEGHGIDLSPSAARVLIVDVDVREDDMNYYLGKQSIAPKTEVERI